MISKNKLLLHMQHEPITADMFISNMCNNECEYCRYKHTNEYTTFEDFQKYVNKLRELGVKGIILTGGGEPTTNPFFDIMCQWLESEGVDYGVNTNFNIYKCVHPVYMKVSLDAWDKESYIAKRGIDAYDKVINNIKHYSTEKGDTQLVLQCVVTAVDDIKKFYAAHQDLQVDAITFRPIESRLGSYYQNSFFDINAAIQEIELLKLRDERVQASFKWNETQTHFDKCYGNWSQYALDCKGNVMICCHRPEDVIGHILDAGIDDIKKSLQIDTAGCDVPCRLTGVNNLLKDIKVSKDINFI